MVTSKPQTTLMFGHPTGLFTLFFAEMWERFSYYGMRALLVFYMTKGFLKYGDTEAYAVYGAYTALVYMTPFFGGMLADRILGARRAVILGGLLMAAGHLAMVGENRLMFFTALALLICGNGFFKPNISTIVGTLYPQGSLKRDGGFTVFYMGINLGAAMAPLLCGYVGETYGWHYGFGLATIGMLTGLAVFVAPTVVTQGLILGGAIAGAVGLFYFHPDHPFTIAVNVFVGVALLLAGMLSIMALGRGGLPKSAGEPTDPKRLRRPLAGLPTELAIYLGTFLMIPVFALLVSGFSPFSKDGKGVTLIPATIIQNLNATGVLYGQLENLNRAITKQDPELIKALQSQLQEQTQNGDLALEHAEGLDQVVGLSSNGQWEAAASEIDALEEQFPRDNFKEIASVVLTEMSRPAGLVLGVAGLLSFGYLIFETLKMQQIPRERMYVVLILTFFSMLFWSFFEQAGSSINNFTDRNVDRVFATREITEQEVGQTIQLQPTQAQLGYSNGDTVFTLDVLNKLREQEQGEDPNADFKIDWTVAPDNVGMGVARRVEEMPASIFQSVNAIFIILLGLPFSALWTFLANRRLEPSTPVKFALGLLQLGLGFGAFWYGAQSADARGMMHLSWLFLGYLLHTTGELCLSPVGLSMITKLSPARLVSTAMGAWFLATAFSQFLAAIIAQFTGVSHGGNAGGAIPIPKETVHVYGDVFFKIAIAAIISSVICLLLSPLLSHWMHTQVGEEDGSPPGT